MNKLKPLFWIPYLFPAP